MAVSYRMSWGWVGTREGSWPQGTGVARWQDLPRCWRRAGSLVSGLSEAGGAGGAGGTRGGGYGGGGGMTTDTGAERSKV